MKLNELRMLNEVTNDLHNAILASQQWHEGQMYNGKPYYTAHVLPVIKMTKKLGGNETHQMVAALHDVVEDGHTTITVLRNRFSPEIGEAVDAISRRQGQETYYEYVARAIRNPIARLVKKADLMVNISNNPPSSLLKRYETALKIVNGETE